VLVDSSRDFVEYGLRGDTSLVTGDAFELNEVTGTGEMAERGIVEGERHPAG
jgi:hypothetical protein